MLSFQEQQKILKPILERETNKHCADCGSHTPTWASLDFGVFVCSNCSGAHRALGPTITRIKSTKLDQWHADWVENMRLGNQQINQFWEADSKTAAGRKPRSGASLDQHNRYVHDKYVRLKYVIDKNGIHPLKAYKSGRTNNHQYHSVDIIQQNSQKFKTHHTSQGDSVMPSILGMPKKYSETPAKKEPFSLLDDDNPPQENWEMKQHKKPQEVHHVHHHHVTHVQNGKITAEQDQFTEYIEPISNNTAQASHNHQASQPTQDPSKLSFDQLFKQPTTQPQTQPQTLPLYTPQQQQQVLGQPQWNQYNQQTHHNYGGYNNYGQQMYNQPHYVNQFAHNPYIGYAPHNNLHASYNMNYGGY